MPLSRLRVAVPDRPGVLARVAAIVADHGGNILSIDVHHTGVVSAVDDLVVDLPDRVDLPQLRNDLTASGAATLLSHQATEGQDPMVTVLRRATEMISTRIPDAAAQLITAVAEVCSSTAVWVSTGEESLGYDAGHFARERGGPIALRSPADALPPAMAERVPPEVWLLAVPEAEVPVNGRVVFVARSIDNEFTNTEIARIEALMILYRRLEQFLSHTL